MYLGGFCFDHKSRYFNFDDKLAQSLNLVGENSKEVKNKENRKDKFVYIHPEHFIVVKWPKSWMCTVMET